MDEALLPISDSASKQEKKEQPPLPTKQCPSAMGPFLTLTLLFVLGVIFLSCDALKQQYAMATGHTQVEHFRVDVRLYESQVKSDGKSVSYSKIPCTPNTTLYEKWGLPSGQCSNAIPLAEDCYGLIIVFWGGGLFAWSVGAFNNDERCYWRMFWVVSCIVHAISMIALAFLHMDRVAWVESLNRHVTHVPYPTPEGGIGLLRTDSFVPDLYWVTFLECCSVIAFGCMTFSIFVIF